MKQSIVEVLVYLLEKSTRQLDDNSNAILSEYKLAVQDLEQVGFSKRLIEISFTWLSKLVEQQQWYVTTTAEKDKRKTIRIFDQEEKLRLSLATRKFILSLEYAGVLDTKMREIVISRLMQLNHWHIGLVETKWVVLLVLLSKLNRKIDEIRNYLLAATTLGE